MARVFRNWGLSIVLLIVFLGCWVGQAIAGRADWNDERRQYGQPPVAFMPYLATSHFWQATAENWESEFLQMAMFIVLTKHLFQKGSSESKDPDDPEASVDEDPRQHQNDPNAPWPVRRGGVALVVYEHSLSTAFLVAFLLSLVLHAVAGYWADVAEQTLRGHPSPTNVDYLFGGKFLFESMQNWQSEFLSILAMVVASIWLRERCSPESKPVHRPNSQNA